MSKQALTKAIEYLENQQKTLVARSVDEYLTWRCISDSLHHRYIRQELLPGLVALRDSLPECEASTDQPDPSIAPMANVIRAPQRGGGKP